MLDVCLQRQLSRATPKPDLQQNVLQQWQRAGAVADVLQDLLYQPGLERQPSRPGWLLDSPAQAVGTERADHHVLGREDASQLRVGRTAVVEVGPQREHDNG